MSKCEKFGYGFMLTQVSATSPGMVALQSTGFMEALVAELWYVLEAATDDTPAAPKVWPLLPIDRNVHKVGGRVLQYWKNSYEFGRVFFPLFS